jgi:3-phenylpropionate/trans-cinnamate dioxygenase ferredoxin subunit
MAELARSVAPQGAVYDGSPCEKPDKKVMMKTGDTGMEDGEQRLVQIGGIDALLCRVGGRTHAVGPICPHQGANLFGGRLRGKTISCPLHGARFDLNTGRAIGGLKYPPITVYTIETDGDGELFLKENETPA